MTKRKRRKNLHRSGNKPKAPGPLPVLDEDSGNKKFEICAAALLFAFAVYQSILYFGHQVVPNSDFPAFVDVGRKILSFELPANFKRVPGLGILQIGLSLFLGGTHPVLTAGWLLNAITHPASIVLAYLIAKKLIGRSAPWFALLVAVNPWTVTMLAQPMAETTLIFFTLLTFYLITRRSSFSYLAASAATMVRYDAAVLIMTVFVIDMLLRKDKNQRLISLLWAFLASVPLGLWLLGTYFHWETSSSAHYFGHFTSNRHVGTGYFRLIWEAACRPLLQLPSWIKALFVQAPASAKAQSIEAATESLYSLSRVIAVIGVLASAVFALVKKNFSAVAVLVFFAVTAGVHTRRMISTQRYCVPLIWIILLLCWYGWQNLFRLINYKERIPKPITRAFQLLVIIIAGTWLVRLLPVISKTSPLSRSSVSLPFVAGAVVISVFVLRTFFSEKRHWLRNLALSVILCLMMVSNQFTLARMVGNGETDAEFKMLADWYVKNARPGEKLATSMPHVVRLFAPEHSKSFISVSRIKGENHDEFIEDCYKRGLAYVAWDSRIGLTPKNFYYRKWGMDRIAPLMRARDIGPYQFVTTLKLNNRRFINIFRLRAAKPPSSTE